MFNDKYCLTQAVLNGKKTMTRRKLTLTLDKQVDGKLIRVYPSKVFFDNGKWLFGYEGRTYNLPRENYPRYGVGEVVAIAQSYHTLNKSGYTAPEWLDHVCESSTGYENKMFVRADLMPHHIRITDVKAERLQDISEKDCLCEGIGYHRYRDKVYSEDSLWGYYTLRNELLIFDTPREAFASLIDKVSGKGTWESNPWVAAYSFELVD